MISYNDTLQGIWAEGLAPAWGSDYHMNINLQMSYWAVESVALPECFTPLSRWLAKLARGGAGQRAARLHYGPQRHDDAWVAHGFTDLWLGSGLLGQAQWALCPVCGAWAALHLWEHFRFAPPGDADATRWLSAVAFPTLRGALILFTVTFCANPADNLT